MILKGFLEKNAIDEIEQRFADIRSLFEGASASQMLNGKKEEDCSIKLLRESKETKMASCFSEAKQAMLVG